MNQKITVKRQDGAVFYCVLSGERSFADQLNEWHFGAANPRGGVAIYVEDTEMDIASQWTPV